jgi:heat-inducible transcriptional repressor
MEAAERRASVLKAIVEEYVQTATPVASQSIAKSRDLGVSSATVRNDMTQLEREGYIVQPHTSAGRIPTDRGYRYFVDHFTQSSALPAAQRRVVSEFFTNAHSALEDLLHETSQMLARITRHAAVVVGPQADAARVRSAQIVHLQQGLALVVVVLSNGTVEKEVVATEVTDEGLARASHELDRALAGHALGSVPRCASTGDEAVDALVQAGVAAIGEHAAESELYVGGASRLAAEQDAFATAASAARLLAILEEQVLVVTLVRDLLDQGVNVSIGSEHAMEELSDCSLVLAPYHVEGTVAGTVGVLGPTRMDYQQALAAVAAVSQQLGRLLLP